MREQAINPPQVALDLPILRTLALGPEHGRRISERIHRSPARLFKFNKSRCIRLSSGWNAAAGLRRIAVNQSGTYLHQSAQKESMEAPCAANGSAL
jgi:hypothetical protein